MDYEEQKKLQLAVTDIGEWLVNQTLFAIKLIGKAIGKSVSDFAYTLITGDRTYVIDRYWKIKS